MSAVLPKPMSQSRIFEAASGQSMRHGFLVYIGGREIRPSDGTN
jgi:hypothetical protein